MLIFQTHFVTVSIWFSETLQGQLNYENYNTNAAYAVFTYEMKLKFSTFFG